MKRSRIITRGAIAFTLLITIGIGAFAYAYRYPFSSLFLHKPMTTSQDMTEMQATELPDHRTVADVLRLCGPKVDAKFEPLCRAQGIDYPPQRIRLLAFKQERLMDVWGANETGAYTLLAEYPIQAASGKLGPKRREGDRQVPEGIYRLTTLNPMSHFHVSLRVDYPNADDIAANPGVPRSGLGGDIYVHGGAASIGCLAMGDVAIEEIFCLVARTELGKREIWIAPVDPRHAAMPETEDQPLRERYRRLTEGITTMRR